jgi:hypothetical protein
MCRGNHTGHATGGVEDTDGEISERKYDAITREYLQPVGCQWVLEGRRAEDGRMRLEGRGETWVA